MGVSLNTQNTCKLYHYFTNKSYVSKPSSKVYYNNRDIQIKRSKVPDYLVPYLTHYWPIEDGDLRDKIGTADLVPELNVEIGEDRFGNENSSMFLNSGYASFKPDVYFNSTDFTIAGWIKPIVMSTSNYYVFVNIFSDYDEDIFYISYGSTAKKPQIISRNPTYYTLFSGNQYVNLNVWNHLAVVLNHEILYIYLNGSLIGSNPDDYPLQDMIRNNCYFGRSAYSGERDAIAYFDDIQFYGRGLNQSAINDLYQNR